MQVAILFQLEFPFLQWNAMFHNRCFYESIFFCCFGPGIILDRISEFAVSVDNMKYRLAFSKVQISIRQTWLRIMDVVPSKYVDAWASWLYSYLLMLFLVVSLFFMWIPVFIFSYYHKTLSQMWFLKQHKYSGDQNFENLKWQKSGILSDMLLLKSQGKNPFFLTFQLLGTACIPCHSLLSFIVTVSIGCQLHNALYWPLLSISLVSYMKPCGSTDPG